MIHYEYMNKLLIGRVREINSVQMQLREKTRNFDREKIF